MTGDRVASLAALLEKSLGAVKAIAGIARLTNPETLSADADYRETLALIDWTPKTRTALDDVVDELDIEVGRSSGGGVEGGVGGTTT